MIITNEDGLTFETWLIRLNTAVHEETEYLCGIDDLPDSCTWDAWNDNVEPKDHAIMVLEEEGFYDYVNAPEPNPHPTTAPLGVYYTEEVVTEGGGVYVVEKSNAARGYARLISYTPPPEARNR